MLVPHTEAIALAVGDQQDRAGRGEIERLLQQIDRGLEYGASAPFHLHPLRDRLRRDVPLVVGGGVAEDETNGADVARERIACDGAEALSQERALHRSGGVEHHGERPVRVIRRRDVTRTGDVRRRALAPAQSRVRPDALLGRELLVEPARELHVPGNGWAVERADLLEQSCRQESASLLVVIREALRQRAAIEIVEGRRVFARPPVAARPLEDVARADAAERRQLPVAAQVDRQPVVDRIGRESLQFFVVQPTERRHLAEIHLVQPAVDHEIARDVPEVRVAPLSPRLVPQPDMQQLVREDELRFGETERGRRVDVDLFRLRRHRGDGDAETPNVVGRLDDRERGSERAQQGIAVDEPAARLFGSGEQLLLRAERRLIAARDADRACDRGDQSRGEGASPMLALLPGHRLRCPKKIARALAGGADSVQLLRDPVAAEAFEEALFAHGCQLSEVGQHVDRAAAEFQVGEELRDDDVAGGVPLDRFLADVEVVEREVEQRVPDDVRPLFGCPAPRGVHVDDAVLGDDGPAVLRALRIGSPIDVDAEDERGEEGGLLDHPPSLEEGLRGGIELRGFTHASPGDSRRGREELRRVRLSSLPLHEPRQIAHDFDEEPGR